MDDPNSTTCSCFFYFLILFTFIPIAYANYGILGALGIFIITGIIWHLWFPTDAKNDQIRNDNYDKKHDSSSKQTTSSSRDE